MPKSLDKIEIGDGKYLTIGDIVVTIYNNDDLERPFRKGGSKFKVAAFQSDSNINVGLYSEKRQFDWHDLDGRVPSGHGYWVRLSTITHYFRILEVEHIVNDSFIFRGQDLRYKKCKILQLMEHGYVLVEMDENIGAGGGDGLGRKGHCIIVPMNVLKEKSSKSKSN